MKAISTLAVAVSLLAGGALLATPALAQKKKEAAAEAGPKLTLSKEERATPARQVSEAMTPPHGSPSREMGDPGLEPGTSSLSETRSNQLS